MDSNLDELSTDKGVASSEHSKDRVKRNYRRRRSPDCGSASDDGRPEHNNSSGPNQSWGHPDEISEHQLRRKDEDKEQNMDTERSYRHYDRQSRNSKEYYKHTDYIKDDKRGEERYNQKSSFRSGREYDASDYRSKDKDRGSKFLDYRKHKDDSSSERLGSGKSVVHFENMERGRDRHRAERDSHDEKRDYRRSSRSERNFSYEPRGHQRESISRRYDGKHHESEGYKSHKKEMDDEKLARDQRKKFVDTETISSKDRITKEPTESFENKDMGRNQDQEYASKRSKFHNLDKGFAGREDVSMFTTTPGGRDSSNSKENQNDKVENDINAAKVDAMKAAELVNRNLTGAGPAGSMTADQKKKLLWGNKKNTTAEEVGHRWDTALFPDQERQEKFKKLMGVKGEIKQNPDNQEGLSSEKQKELQQDLEKQYTAGLRRRDGRTVGLGL